jgi:hypothetical protein
VFRDITRRAAEAVLRVKQQPAAAAPALGKRAVGFFPETAARNAEVRDTVAVRFHHLLVSLEGSERTGCMKISSQHSQSRSAMLLYRGRVVGAVYGARSMRGQYLQEDARKCALLDLASPGNMLDAYELPEELVLSAASLFYGETLDFSVAQSLEQTFDTAIASLQRSGLPGCVVVNSWEEQTICIVYIAAGRIVGLFSAADGWTHGTPQSAKRFLRDGRCKIHASILPLTGQPRFGFSLTGLADRPSVAFNATGRQDFSPAAPAGAEAPAPEAMAQTARRHRETVTMHRSARTPAYSHSRF